MYIDIPTFTGMRPAVAKHLLNPAEAQYILGADTSSGALRHALGNQMVLDFESKTVSVWLQDLRSAGVGMNTEQWLAYPDLRQFVESHADDQFARVYMSQELGGLRVSAYVEGELKEYTLGVPAPKDNPVLGEASDTRTGTVEFIKDLNAFKFSSELRPMLFPGMKLKFSGSSLPSGISASTSTTYVVLFEAAGGHYAFASENTPNLPVVLNASGSGECAVLPTQKEQTRLYAFTVVNIFGEESAPSPLSPRLDVDYSSKVELTGLVYEVSLAYAPIKFKRIYRAATGTQATTDLLFLAEILANETTYTDIKTDAELGENITTSGWALPSANLRGLRTLPDGTLVAHTETDICFSEINPYAWPSRYQYKVRGKIVGIGVSRRTVFAFTDSSVYALTVDDPSFVGVTALNGYTPCIDARGIAESPLGVFFPSNDGLYLVAEGQQAQNITDGLINDRAWRSIVDKGIVATFFDSSYLAFVEVDGLKTCLVLDFGTDGQARLRYLPMYGLSLTVIPSKRRLYYVAEVNFEAALWRLFEVGADFERVVPVVWKSKLFTFAAPINMAACRIETGDFEKFEFPGKLGAIGASQAGQVVFGGEETDRYPFLANLLFLTLYGDGEVLDKVNPEPFELTPLVGGCTARSFEVEIKSYFWDITRVRIGTTSGEVL